MNSIFAPGHHWAFWLLFHGFIINDCEDSLMDTHNRKKKHTNRHNECKASPHTVVYVGCNTVCCSQGAEKKTFKTTESKHQWPPAGTNTHCLSSWRGEACPPFKKPIVTDIHWYNFQFPYQANTPISQPGQEHSQAQLISCFNPYIYQ